MVVGQEEEAEIIGERMVVVMEVKEVGDGGREATSDGLMVEVFVELDEQMAY